MKGFKTRLEVERGQLAARLKELRKKVRLTQEQVAEQSGLHFTYIVKLEGARVSASLSTLVALAMLYKIEVRGLF